MNLLSLILLISILVCTAADDEECPTIVSRYEWGARSSSLITLPIRPAPWVVIHDTNSVGCLPGLSSKSTCSEIVRSIQNYHMDTNGWADIGYNFLVGDDGKIYEGRGWEKQGAHTPRYNDKSIGIAFIGTFGAQLPVPKTLEAYHKFINCSVSLGHIDENYGLIGHKLVKTDCPGTALYNEIMTWPNYRP